MRDETELSAFMHLCAVWRCFLHTERGKSPRLAGLLHSSLKEGWTDFPFPTHLFFIMDNLCLFLQMCSFYGGDCLTDNFFIWHNMNSWHIFWMIITKEVGVRQRSLYRDLRAAIFPCQNAFLLTPASAITFIKYDKRGREGGSLQNTEWKAELLTG